MFVLDVKFLFVLFYFSFLSSIKNGSLTRERIRNEYANKSWETFDELLKKTPAGNGGNLALYFDVQEIFFPLKGDFKFNPDGVRVDKFKLDEVEVRACIEGQFMMLRIQTENFGYKIGKNKKKPTTKTKQNIKCKHKQNRIKTI